MVRASFGARVRALLSSHGRAGAAGLSLRAARGSRTALGLARGQTFSLSILLKLKNKSESTGSELKVFKQKLECRNKLLQA